MDQSSAANVLGSVSDLLHVIKSWFCCVCVCAAGCSQQDRLQLVQLNDKVLETHQKLTKLSIFFYAHTQTHTHTEMLEKDTHVLSIIINSLCVAVLLVECSGLDQSIKWTNGQPLLSTRKLNDDMQKIIYTYQYHFESYLEGSQFSSKPTSCCRS